MKNINWTGGRGYLCATILFAALAVPASGANGAGALTLEALDRTELPAEGANGVPILEFSGLSWDEDEQLLYAVSDGGVLHHLRLRVAGDRLVEVVPVFSVRLSTPASKVSGKAVSNAEGITTVNDDNGKTSDSELLIAFEDGPSVGRFSPQGGWIADVELPGPLADPQQYSKKNSRLEAVAFDERHGIVTAPESPLKDQPEGLHTLYAADGTTWSFEVVEADSRLKAIQKMADGNLLVLERTNEGKGDRAARLRHLDITQCGSGGQCDVADLSTAPEALLADNFEGLARLSEDLFLIVTDKTEKDGEPTALVLFKVTTKAE